MQRMPGAILLYAAGSFGVVEARTAFREGFNRGTASTCDLLGGGGNLAFSAGWLLRNAYNRTPGVNPACLNGAREVRDNSGGDAINCVTFSTSFYEPAGVADDWMWSPDPELTATLPTP